MPKWIKGTDLTPRQVAMVKACFLHRGTEENRRAYAGRCPMCVASTRGGAIVTGPKESPKVWTVEEWHAHHAPLTTDAEWLAAYAFRFTSDGRQLAGDHCDPVYLHTEAAA